MSCRSSFVLLVAIVSAACGTGSSSGDRTTDGKTDGKTDDHDVVAEASPSGSIDASIGNGNDGTARIGDSDAAVTSDIRYDGEAGPSWPPPLCAATVVTSLAPPCGKEVCGNGKLDSCDLGTRQDPYTFTEPCDGVNVGGQSCTSLGYPGGTLVCGANCLLDTTGCDTCRSGPRLVACDQPNVSVVTPMSVALAVRNDEIWVAWVSGSGWEPTHRPVHLARFSGALQELEEIDCVTDNAWNVGLVPTSTGWLLQVGILKPPQIATISLGLEIHALDQRGKPVGAPRVIAKATTEAWNMVPTEDGALMLYALPEPDASYQADVIVERLDAAGKAMWTTNVGMADFEGPHRALWRHDHAIIASQLGSWGIRLTRLSAAGAVEAQRVLHPDGGLVGGGVPPLGMDSRNAALVETDSGPRIVWADDSSGPEPGIAFGTVDPNSLAVSRLATLGTFPGISPAIAIGGDAAILLPVAGTYNVIGRTARLDLTRVAGDGRIVVAPFSLNQDPNPVGSYSLARFANDVIVAWYRTDSPGALGLARANLSP